MMEIRVNDAGRAMAVGSTIADLVSELALPQRGIAVAVNGEVVRRALWGSHALAPGDRVEVLTAAQGG